MAAGRSYAIFLPAFCAATGSASASSQRRRQDLALLNLLTGALVPDAGTVRLGTNLAQVTLDQRREILDPAATLAETLTGGSGDTVMVGDQSRHVIGYMKDFLFPAPSRRGTGRAALSGGERGARR